MSKQYPECPLYNHMNCKDRDNKKVCALVRKDRVCLREHQKRKKNRTDLIAHGGKNHTSKGGARWAGKYASPVSFGMRCKDRITEIVKGILRKCWRSQRTGAVDMRKENEKDRRKFRLLFNAQVLFQIPIQEQDADRSDLLAEAQDTAGLWYESGPEPWYLFRILGSRGPGGKRLLGGDNKIWNIARSYFRTSQVEQKEELGVALYSAQNLRNRYTYNKPRVVENQPPN